MTQYLLDISPIALCEIYAELVECAHGVNGYGSHTAEIYAFRLMRHSPLLNKDTAYNEEYLFEESKLAAHRLFEIVELFCKRYNRRARVDGITPRKWLKTMRVYGFDHRAHIEISLR